MSGTGHCIADIKVAGAAGSNVWVFAMAFFDDHFRSFLVIHTILVCVLLGVALVMMR